MGEIGGVGVDLEELSVLLWSFWYGTLVYHYDEPVSISFNARLVVKDLDVLGKSAEFEEQITSATRLCSHSVYTIF